MFFRVQFKSNLIPENNHFQRTLLIPREDLGPGNSCVTIKNYHIIYINRVRPRERFMDPSLNFVHDHLFFSKFTIIYFLLFRVRLRHFLDRALRLGQARGPSAAATWTIISMSNIQDPCTKLIGGGGGAKNHSLGNYRLMKSIFVLHHFMVRLIWVYIGSDSSSAIRT